MSLRVFPLDNKILQIPKHKRLIVLKPKSSVLVNWPGVENEQCNTDQSTALYLLTGVQSWRGVEWSEEVLTFL